VIAEMVEFVPGAASRDQNLDFGDILPIGRRDGGASADEDRGGGYSRERIFTLMTERLSNLMC
jgi:hypothetical protein